MIRSATTIYDSDSFDQDRRILDDDPVQSQRPDPVR
jgi:hypothetical protein